MRPFTLVSLLDMLKQNAAGYLAIGMHLEGARIALSFENPLDEEEREGFRAQITGLIGFCEKLDLRVSAAMFRKRVDDLPETDREFALLVEAIEAELGAKLFLFVPTHRATWFARDDMLSEDGRAAFPMAAQELREAGNAFAAGLPTASVFHSMRALEHGLRALAHEVSLTFDVQQWARIIEDIEKAIERMSNSGIAGLDKAAKDAHLLFLSQAARQFAYFKDGWRNYTMHAKGPYDEQQALIIMSHVRDFLDGLSAKLREPS